MKWTLCFLGAVATQALNIPRNGSSIDSSLAKRAFSLGIPSDCLKVNNVSVGFLPDEEDSGTAYTMAEINSKLGLAPSCFYGWYSQLSSLPENDDQLTKIISNLKTSGALYSSTVADEIAAAMKTFTNEGIEVWLRFGHEMNYYASVGTYTGTAAEFVTAWNNVYAAVHGNDMVKLWWSPNIDSVSNIQPWFPGNEYVDIVGIDCYPSGTVSSSSFDTCYQDFYNAFSKPYDLPFAIGETGAGDGQKEAWLSDLVCQDAADWPNYVGFSWFEYDKEADFRIVETDATTLAETKTTLSGDGCSGTCTWGWEGWECSATAPCQSPYTCQSGYCH